MYDVGDFEDCRLSQLLTIRHHGQSDTAVVEDSDHSNRWLTSQRLPGLRTVAATPRANDARVFAFRRAMGVQQDSSSYLSGHP